MTDDCASGRPSLRAAIHTLNADGTVRSPGFDWRVNETALRQAEAAETARVGPRRHAKLAE
jgi:hypothetical protein